MKGLLAALLLCGSVASAQKVVKEFSAVSSGAGTISDMDLPSPTSAGSVLITMPLLLTPDVKVISVTDNAANGGNIYKQVPGTHGACKNQSVDIWYCENCKGNVTELKIHMSDHVRASINTFLEVSGLATSSVVDGEGAHLIDGSAANDGTEPGPKITTTAKDFVIERYFSEPPLPSGVKPKQWTFSKSYAYLLSADPGDYQATLTDAKTGSNYCASAAAFKIADSAPAH